MSAPEQSLLEEFTDLLTVRALHPDEYEAALTAFRARLAALDAAHHGGNRTMSKWIRFDAGPPSASGKTATWTILTIDGAMVLGEVRWYGPWRKYTFYPRSETVFEQDCLRDIAAFIEAHTREHRGASR